MSGAPLHRGGALAVVVAAAAWPAHATCPPDLIPNALHGRLGATTVALFEPLLLDMIPPQFAVPQSSFTLMECSGPFEDTVVTPTSGTVTLVIERANLSLHDNAVELDMTLRAGATADFRLQICALPDADCRAVIAANAISVHARMEPSVNGCALSLPLTVLDIRVDPYTTSVSISDCGLYDNLWDLVYDWYRATLVDLIVDKVRSAVWAEAPAMVEAFTSGFLAPDVTLMGLRLNAALEGISVDPTAVTVALAANVTPVGGAAPCLPAGSSLPPQAPVSGSPVMGDAQLAVAASQPFLERALHAAWLAGLLCFDSAALGLDLDSALADFAPGASLAATVSMVDAPSLAIAQDGMDLACKRLEAEVTLTAASGAPTRVHMTTSASLSADLAVDLAQRALTLSVTSLRTGGLTLDYQGGALAFSAAAVTRLIQNTVLPAFADNLGPLPLTSSLLAGASVAFHLDGVSATSDHLRADLRLWPIDQTDDIAPVTVVVRLPAVPSPAHVTLEMASIDDRTPREFMRHDLVVDGTAEPAPRAGTRFVLSGLGGGEHRITIAAVDLSGNVDSTPVTVSVWVDNQAPAVVIASAPAGVIEVESAVIEVSAADDWTPAESLALYYTVGVIQRGAAPDRVIDEGAMRGTSLSLSSLPEDEVVRVTITATDAAGNRGEASVAFAANRAPTLNCAAGDNALHVAALAAVALICRVRRRHRSR